MDEDGLIHATREARLYDLQPGDQLYAVVSGPNVTVPNLSGVHVGGARAEQALWQIHEIPDHGMALQSLDAMLMININSENLSSAQRQAIRRWVQGGGHLIMIGGPSAQASAQALGDMMPLQPKDSRSLDDVSALARFSGDNKSQLTERTIVSVGSLHEDARLLVEQDGLPLLARRELGAGLVDFLAIDPTLEPLASWGQISRLWMQMLASRAPHPAWVTGFTSQESGAEAVANLPGVDLLPPLQTLCLFLSLYIVMIGPVNYYILSRIKRSGWGWITIPLVIIVFTGVAWTVGFSLRGAEIIVSRLSVVQSFPDSDEARLEQFVGLLSPRRATYSLDVPDDHFLAVAGATTPSALFASNTIQTSTEIRQGSRFGAHDSPSTAASLPISPSRATSRDRRSAAVLCLTSKSSKAAGWRAPIKVSSAMTATSLCVMRLSWDKGWIIHWSATSRRVIFWRWTGRPYMPISPITRHSPTHWNPASRRLPLTRRLFPVAGTISR